MQDIGTVQVTPYTLYVGDLNYIFEVANDPALQQKGIKMTVIQTDEANQAN